MTDRDMRDDRLALPVDAEAIRDKQIRRALRRLDHCGELTSEQRAIVEQLADRLTAELLDLFDADEQDGTNADADKRRLRETAVSGLAVRENH